MFKTHVDSWDHDRVYDALYEQVQTMACHRLGGSAIKLLSQRFDESVGRLFWSETGSFWCVPLVFILEDDAVILDSLQAWDARVSSSFLGLTCRSLSQWMQSTFDG